MTPPRRAHEDGYLVVDAEGATTVPGVFAGGDLTRGLQLVQVAAGSGAVAGIGCALSLENDPGPRRRFPPASRTRARRPAPAGSR